ncbi:hypothetical protein H0E87_020100 [Populus deltoides]|uniref:Protein DETOXIFICATION n=1 Tax=Populus deltoides TaxID=3696 RepID=A0A8T2XJC2_POPDE|nr:hypothetical protein H0E87_020100 [Populus deltoides]
MDSKESRGELQEPLLLSSTEPETNDHYHEADSRLENVLNDTNLSYFMRLGLASWIELKLLFRLAAPAVFVYLINNSLSLSTRIFSGHLGNLGLGMGSAVETLCGQSYGAQRFEMLGTFLQRATVVLTLTGIPLAAVYVFAKPILILLGEPTTVASAAAVFVYGLLPQIFAYAVNFPIQKFLQAQSIVTPSAIISAITLVFHLFLTWLAVYKLGWGLIGASLVLSLSWWIVVAAQFLFIVMSRRCKKTWTGFTSQAFNGLWDFLKLSTGSAAMLCLETWYFQILILIAGLLKNPELALNSLSVCMSITGFLFMISVGFNAAASVRVSNELGAGNHKSAAFSVAMVTLVSFIIALIEAGAILALRHVISYVFTVGETVANAVSELCPLLAVTLILNGVQPVLSGVAVGCGWQAFVAYVNVGCYYVVGIPFGCLIGFKFDLGVKGIWSGMIGGTLLQTLILLWVTFRTDWKEEKSKALTFLGRLVDVNPATLTNMCIACMALRNNHLISLASDEALDSIDVPISGGEG